MSPSCETVRDELAERGGSCRKDARLAAHLERCPACEALLCELESLERGLAMMPRLEPPAALLEATLQRIESAAGEPQREPAARQVEPEAPLGLGELLGGALRQLLEGLAALASGLRSPLRWISRARYAPRRIPLGAIGALSALALFVVFIGGVSMLTMQSDETPMEQGSAAP
ncbi:MAG: hypothetical protein OEY14_14495, partial [Myxococcales bacterium]|nr:hypothetical protein [Myxococcales bacterium]